MCKRVEDDACSSKGVNCCAWFTHQEHTSCKIVDENSTMMPWCTGLRFGPSHGQLGEQNLYGFEHVTMHA